MVAKNAYLFIGQDALSKDARLEKIKEEFLPQGLQYFNFDILHAKELTLLTLQEKILYFPVKASKRIIVIRDAGHLKEDIQEFILGYLRKPSPQVILIFDIQHPDSKDGFIVQLARCTQALRFKETTSVNTFTLGRQIESRRTNDALRVLNQLLKNGEKPERILGGLRYAGEKNAGLPAQTKKVLKALLDCDIDIKTSRLKADFALEKLVIRLCSFSKPLH